METLGHMEDGSGCLHLQNPPLLLPSLASSWLFGLVALARPPFWDAPFTPRPWGVMGRL